jgi:hypothetical protein
MNQRLEKRIPTIIGSQHRTTRNCASMCCGATGGVVSSAGLGQTSTFIINSFGAILVKMLNPI